MFNSEPPNDSLRAVKNSTTSKDNIKNNTTGAHNKPVAAASSSTSKLPIKKEKSKDKLKGDKKIKKGKK